MKWYLDVEGYQLRANYLCVKELALLSEDGIECYIHYVKSPRYHHFDVTNPTIQFQYNRHHLHWEEGGVNFYRVMRAVSQKVQDEYVFVKGSEKVRLLERYLRHVVDLEMLPSFKYLNCSMSECCSRRHGKFCARRKVYELKNYIDNACLH